MVVELWREYHHVLKVMTGYKARSNGIDMIRYRSWCLKRRREDYHFLYVKEAKSP